nr:unnamed protein product [Callosobruchus analis]
MEKNVIDNNLDALENHDGFDTANGLKLKRDGSSMKLNITQPQEVSQECEVVCLTSSDCSQLVPGDKIIFIGEVIEKILLHPLSRYNRSTYEYDLITLRAPITGELDGPLLALYLQETKLAASMVYEATKYQLQVQKDIARYPEPNF